MKLATFTHGSGDRVGALDGSGEMLIDLTSLCGTTSMQALIEGGPAELERVRQAVKDASGDHLVRLAAVRLRAPIPVPVQIRDFSVFPTHIRQAPVGMRKLGARLAGEPELDIAPEPEVPAVYRERPIYYFSNRFGVVGPEAKIAWPGYSTIIDFELEIAAVLWRGGKNITAARAGEHIFGYTIFNDFSARDAQMAEMRGMLGPTKGKSFDTGNAMGPFLVTRDEIGDPRHLRATARINGQVWVSDTLEAMLHPFEQMIAYVSRDETLHAGEVFGSGTIGNGCGLEVSRYLAHGDVVELEVEKIGVLRNTISARS